MAVSLLGTRNQADEQALFDRNNLDQRCDNLALSQIDSLQAVMQVLDAVKFLTRASEAMRFAGETQSATVTYKCTQCVFLFWHVLDVRFNHMLCKKTRADVLLRWSPEFGLWRNRRGTVNLNAIDLAAHCIDRLRSSSNGCRSTHI